MTKLSSFLKERGIRILLIAGVLKLAILLFFVREATVININLMISSLLFLMFMGIVAHFLLKSKLTYTRIFTAGALGAFLYNWGLGTLGVTASMAMDSILLSAFDTGLLAILVAFLMGVKGK